MGLRDFEDFNATIWYNDKTRLENLISDKEKCYSYIKYCLGDVGDAINNHCFKFSRLRDEIFFVSCYLIRKDNSTEPYLYKFFVNEKSFWNRFNIFLKNDPNTPLSKSNNITAIDVLNIITNNKDLVHNCSINLFPYEENIINSLIHRRSSVSSEIYKYNLENGSLCKILDFTHYNKRVWYELLSQEVKDPESENGNTLSCNFNYKDPSNVMYYNPNDPKFRDIMFLYL